jgi:hypothetical protein
VIAHEHPAKKRAGRLSIWPDLLPQLPRLQSDPFPLPKLS